MTFRAFRPPAFAALLLAAMLAAAARADGWSPLGFSLASMETAPELRYSPDRPWDFSLPSYGTAIYGVRLGLFSAANRNMYGLSVSLTNMRHYWSGDNNPVRFHPDGDVAGIQVGGFFNCASSSRYGALQAAGFANVILDGGAAFQVASLVNRSEDALDGIQITGAYNYAKAFRGLQVAAVNQVDGDMSGVQLGLFNYVENEMSGIQIGAMNYIDGTMNGVQIGAINYAPRANGVQIGVFNLVDTSFAGIQIGVLNIANTETEFSGVQLGALNAWDSADPTALPLLRIYF